MISLGYNNAAKSNFLIYYLSSRHINNIFIIIPADHSTNINIPILTNECYHHRITFTIKECQSLLGLQIIISNIPRDIQETSALLLDFPKNNINNYYDTLSKLNYYFQAIFTFDILEVDLEKIYIRNHYILESYYPTYALQLNNELKNNNYIKHSHFTSIALNAILYFKQLIIQENTTDNSMYDDIKLLKLTTIEGDTLIWYDHHLKRISRIGLIKSNNPLVIDNVYSSATVVIIRSPDMPIGYICNWDKVEGNDIGEFVSRDYFQIVYIDDNSEVLFSMMKGRETYYAYDPILEIKHKLLYSIIIKYDGNMSEIEEYAKSNHTVTFVGCITKKCINDILLILAKYKQYLISYYSYGNLCHPYFINTSPTMNQYSKNIVLNYISKGVCSYVFIDTETERSENMKNEFKYFIEIVGCSMISVIINENNINLFIDSIDSENKYLVISPLFHPLLLLLSDISNVEVLLLNTDYNISYNLEGSPFLFYSYHFSDMFLEDEISKRHFNVFNETGERISFIGYMIYSHIIESIKLSESINHYDIMQIFLHTSIYYDDTVTSFNEFNYVKYTFYLIRPQYPLKSYSDWEFMKFDQDITLPSEYSLYNPKYYNMKCNFSEENYVSIKEVYYIGGLYSTSGKAQKFDLEIIAGLYTSFSYLRSIFIIF